MTPFLKRGLVKTADFDAYVDETQGRERDFFKEVLRSRKLAWIGAAVATGGMFAALAVLGVQTYISSQPVPPFILRVDNATGQTDVVSVMKQRTDSYGDLLDQHWLTEYVRHRESYDWQTVQADYNATGLMSTPDVAAEYRAGYYDGNDHDRVKRLANNARVLVAIESAPVITPGTSTATVRFTTTTRWKQGMPDSVQHWIATVGYAYVNAPMTPGDRLINPLGFQVRSYRIDAELGVGAGS